MFSMKNWLVYFLAVVVGVTFLPIAASKTVAAKEIPTIIVGTDGEKTEIDVEEYTLRLLLASGGDLTEPEAMKSLAVSARSCAMYLSYYGCKHEEFDVCSDKNCCFPLGDAETAEPEFYNECKTAVDETFGEILTYNSLPAMALFTLCSGSSTADCEEFEYLTAVSEAARCEVHITEKTVESEKITPDSLKINSCLVYDSAGKCDFAVIDGKLIDGADLMAVLSLPSAEILLETNENNVVAKAYGIGHGYGLNLCGAEMKAKEQNGYDEILKYYFPKLSLNKIYNK